MKLSTRITLLLTLAGVCIGSIFITGCNGSDEDKAQAKNYNSSKDFKPQKGGKSGGRM